MPTPSAPLRGFTMSPDPIRVLIVDDSPFMRKALEHMLSTDDIKVAGTARDGQDALEQIKLVKPDIVTLDVEMPRMDGLTCLKRIMSEMPLPVLMVSSLTQEGATATLEALAAGALDFIPKETSVASASILQIQQDLQEKIRKLARSPRFAKRPPQDGTNGTRHPYIRSKGRPLGYWLLHGRPQSSAGSAPRLAEVPACALSHCPAHARHLHQALRGTIERS